MQASVLAHVQGLRRLDLSVGSVEFKRYNLAQVNKGVCACDVGSLSNTGKRNLLADMMQAW
jgi:hypothetical protein